MSCCQTGEMMMVSFHGFVVGFGTSGVGMLKEVGMSNSLGVAGAGVIARTTEVDNRIMIASNISPLFMLGLI